MLPLPLPAGNEAYQDLHSQHHSTCASSYDEQFTLAAAYLASLQPPTQPSHATDERPTQSQTPQYGSSSPSSSTLFDSHVSTCLAALHSSMFVPSPPQPYQHLAPVPSSAHMYDLPSEPQPRTSLPFKYEEAASGASSSWHCPPNMSIESSKNHTLPDRHSSYMAAACVTQPYMHPPLDAASSVAAPSNGVVSLSIRAQLSIESLSVPPMHYPLTRLESASHCSTDSVLSYQSSPSSAGPSPLSPPMLAAVKHNRNAQHDRNEQASSGQCDGYSTAPPVVLIAASPPSPAAHDSAQPVNNLRLPSCIYPTVRSVISAALQAASPSSDAASTVLAGSDKRKGDLLDTERRLKHRVIDANRRRRETILVERFAQLSGQRTEPLARDRVSTLEVACDRYEELTVAVEAMRARMRRMEERLQALDGTAANDNQAGSRGKRRAARKRADGQSAQPKRTTPSNLPSHATAIQARCEMTVSDSDSASSD